MPLRHCAGLGCGVPAAGVRPPEYGEITVGATKPVAAGSVSLATRQCDVTRVRAVYLDK